jgi:replicative DNA helicase
VTRELIPPHDERAEKAVLGLVLMQPSALDEIADLAVNDFFMPANRVVLEAMIELQKRGVRVETVALSGYLKTTGMASRLPEGEAYLLHLANAAEIGGIQHFARIVSEKAVLRRMIKLCGEIASACYGDVGDVSEFVGEVRGRVAEIELPAGSDGPVRLGAELTGALEEIEKRSANPEQTFVLTGIEAFDREISGLAGETLVLIAARPSRGKSALLWNFALRASRCRIPTLTFSLEMSKQLLTFRALAFDGQVNSRNIMSGRLSGTEWMKLQASASRLANDAVWFDDRNLSRFSIASEARRWRAQNPSSQALILIDYLGMVKKTGDADSVNEELGDITSAMKRLAKDLKIPVVLAAQLNRDNEKENRKPKMTDLRGSGAIEQDADVIIFPWWDGEAPRYGRHPATLIVGKNRNGAIAEIPVDWMPEFTMFTDREDLQQPQQGDLVQ